MASNANGTPKWIIYVGGIASIATIIGVIIAYLSYVHPSASGSSVTGSNNMPPSNGDVTLVPVTATPTPTPPPPTPTPALTAIWNSYLDRHVSSTLYNTYHSNNGYYYIIVDMTFKNLSLQSQVLKGSMLVLHDSAGTSYAEDQVADRQQAYEVDSGGSITAEFAFVIPTYACTLTLDFNDPLGKTFYWNFQEVGPTCSV